MALIIEKDFSEVEVAECAVLYESIVKTHDKCAGSGMVKEGEGVADCDCEAIFKYVRSLIYSRLPRRFWGVPFASASKLFDQDKEQAKFDSLVTLFNRSCILMGLPGSGKTSALTLVGKAALWAGVNVLYLTADDLLGFVRKDSEHKIYLDRLAGSDIVLFDNLTRYNKSEWANGQIELNLRKIHDGGASLVIASAMTLDELRDSLSENLAVFLEKFDNRIIVNYTGKGDIKLNQYFEKPIIDEARKHYKESLSLSS